MNLQEVTKIYESFQSSKCQALVKSTLKYAIRYTNLRVEWWLLDTQGRIEIDDERTRAHNAFISTCNALARNMNLQNEDTAWRNKLGNDRKVIGDFAVLLVAVMGVKAR